MSETVAVEPFKKLSGWAIAYAILLILAGIVSIALPFASGLGLAIIVGWLIVVSGIFHLADAFHAKGAGSFAWRLLIGLLYIAGGILIVLHPAYGLLTLTLVLGIIFMVEGTIGIVAFLRHRTMKGASWVLIDGLITLLLGLFIWWDGPAAALWLIGTLVGVNLIFSGITRLMFWTAARRILPA